MDNIKLLLKWSQNKLINPFTNKKIIINKSTFNKLNKMYLSVFPNGYSPIDAINTIDPVSLTEIWKIENNIKILVYSDINNLIYYKDIDNNIYCFEKETIEYFKFYNILINPLNYKPFPENIFENIKCIEKKYTLKDNIIKLFQELSNISVFIDYKLFLELNNSKLITLYNELKDLVEKNINKKLQKEILQKFTIINIYQFTNKSFEEKQLYLYEFLNKLVNNNSSSAKLCKYIVIVTLGLVIPKIKTDYPDYIMN